MPMKNQETQVEWTWTAPGQTAVAKPSTSSSSSLPPVGGETPVPRPAAGSSAGSSSGSPVGAPSAGAASGAATGATPGSVTAPTGTIVGPGTMAGSPTLPTGPGGGAVPLGEGLAIIPPRIRERPPLQLPATLSRAGLSGEVLLLVEVREDGRVGKVSLERSSGNKELDELARDNVLRWKFDPAWQPQGNKTVRVLTAVWVRFGKNRSEQK